MMVQVDTEDLEARLSYHLEKVENGETVVICRRGVPIAELRPLAKRPSRPRPVGIDRGMQIPQSFFEPLPDDMLEEFEGGARVISATHSGP